MLSFYLRHFYENVVDNSNRNIKHRLGPMGGKWNLSYMFGIGSIFAASSFGLMGFCGIMGVLNPTLILIFMIMNGIS